MLEKYIKLKERYPKSLIIIKAGNFYDCINDDAIIINKLFNYKIKELSKYIRVGFPIASLNRVRTILTKYEIKYITVDNNDITYSKFIRNNYSKYSSNDYFIVKNKINSINDILSNNILNPSINSIVSSIEGIICRIS